MNRIRIERFSVCFLVFCLLRFGFCFCFCFFETGSLHSLGWLWVHFGAQAGLELITILLLQPLKCRHYGLVLPCPAHWEDLRKYLWGKWWDVWGRGTSWDWRKQEEWKVLIYLCTWNVKKRYSVIKGRVK